MKKPTAIERARVRWYAEKNPGAFCDALRYMVQAVKNMDPRLLDLYQEELEKDIEAGEEQTGPHREQEPLTEAQQEPFDLIRREGPLTGKEIVNRLGISSESAFTTHYVPALKKHGILNRRGLGYYHPDTYQPD